jgi:indolepyruvate ferredoxin oxidoreductase
LNAPLSRDGQESFEVALARALKEVTLDDKYTLEQGRAYMSGTQALVRLPMLQRERDRRAGLNTAGFVSGYRGSPLGGLDQALWKAQKHLASHQVVFKPGLNEDLAATAVWGTQQLALTGKSKVDGVFSLWYGKGPGVDRTGDVFKHGNAAGTSKYGGVIALAGDDHGAKSSTLPHQSDHIFKACGLPVFYPATVQEYLDLGLHGFAMSRFSGLWVSMKTVTEVVEASSSVVIDPERVKILLPEDFSLPESGLNIRWPDSPLEQEARLFNYKWYAALAYVRSNRLNHTVIDSPQAWFGIVTGGKAYLDTRQALDDLGLDVAACAKIGIRVFKCGVVWPLEAHTVSEFAEGLQEILVVEEKRQILEYALKEELYNWPDHKRPKIYGKFDEKDGRGGEWAMPQGQWLLPGLAELSPQLIAKAIAARLLNPGKYGARFELSGDMRAHIESRLAIIAAKERALALPHTTVNRVPTFCSGCPHNTSTHLPEGSRGMAGIGCHYMVTWMPERRTENFTQMGGEGVPWIGQAPFCEDNHVFANLGDGTYFHSGLLAIRASIAAKVNITYKILYNDAVAMTGGQPIDGTLTVPQIIGQLKAEGARKIVVVTDEPDKYNEVRRAESATFDRIEIHGREHLDWVQKQIREIPGCTILIYDQTCASEKRRRRKKVVNGVPGFPDPAKRVVINEAVCEGCGDCSVQSSCVSVEPVETEFGRKRKINQSSCNKDYSCVNGFCPSFVTVEGGTLKKGGGAERIATQEWPVLPEPAPIGFDATEPGVLSNSTYGILVTGVGGSGVVTIGQILGMAAHLEGKGVSVLDMAGLAQKGGAVYSHVQIAESPEHLYSTRIATGEADLMIACDLVVGASNEALSKMRPAVTRAVINSDIAPTSDFLRDRDWTLPEQELKANILDAAGAKDIEFLEASDLAVKLLGDSIYTNPFLMGYAWQKGWLPLRRESIIRAFELNAVSVKSNQDAFEWGRRYAHDALAVKREVVPSQVISILRNKVVTTEALNALIESRAEILVKYQNLDYAARYRKLVDEIKQAELRRIASVKAGASLSKTANPVGTQSSPWGLTEAVARNYFKLLAYKDEYEVARLHCDPAFRSRIAEQFEGDYTLRFHLAPPILSRTDPKTGKPRKIRFGAWMMRGFHVLAAMKGLRGTVFDVFGYTRERRQERALIAQYEQCLEQIVKHLDESNYSLALELAKVPDEVRGYGHVKEPAIKKARSQLTQLLTQIENPSLRNAPVSAKIVTLTRPSLSNRK